MLKRLRHISGKIRSDSLYKNSVYLMMSTIIMTGLGFFFWTINARLFRPDQIGMATTIISAMSLLMTIAGLGMGTALVRFLPTSKNKNHKINTCMTVSFLASIVISTIFLMGISVFSPKLLFIKQNMIFAFIFMFIVAFQALFSMMDNVFNAYRANRYTLLKNTIFSSMKLVFPFLLVLFGIGAFGIFVSWGLAGFTALAVSIFILTKKFKFHFKPAIYDSILKKIGRYSFANYLAGLLAGLPALVLPLIITNRLNPETTAYYYIAMMIAGLLFMIPSAVSQSLFAEGSAKESSLQNNTKKAAKVISLLLIPSILFMIFFGKYLLMLFNTQYVAGATLLSILSLSTIPLAFRSVYSTILNVKKRMKLLITVNFIYAASIIGLSLLLINQGLSGLGIAWLSGTFISSVFAYIFTRRK